MASFTTRILLRGAASESEYETLHVSMRKQGFLRTITSNDGIVYKLPPAEYNLTGSYNRDQVLDLAKEAIKALPNRIAEILITESAGRIWNNLQHN